MSATTVHVLEESYRGFLIRIPVPEQDGRMVSEPVQVSVTAITDHAATHLDLVRWDAVERSEGDLHTLAHIKHAIDVALEGAEHQPPLPGVFEPGLQ
ncbi:hypothetical protein SAMN05428957_101271 [Oryzisolibacter propanilivorax]|uniref:Uncharacterized protein n=1 Tax=Oryzisolibacter propanilivorax TaxID=1527607 RepID=A0A1G9P996_9BURK|nr:hypothetical protein [Oryzisolibacter propanilivorax]SDL95358.1 hypothetical protein SAMN05428957_101271 [Oryzisolibacter propanilivorax]